MTKPRALCTTLSMSRSSSLATRLPTPSSLLLMTMPSLMQLTSRATGSGVVSSTTFPLPSKVSTDAPWMPETALLLWAMATTCL